MEARIYQEYVKILEEELVMAMGCTEPIAVAYAAAVAVKALGEQPESMEVNVSANIIKNVKSVVVPCTGGMKGIRAAVCAGVVSGEPEKELEILAGLTEEQKGQVGSLMQQIPIQVNESDSGYIFDIQIKAFAQGHTGFAQIAGYHTNVICIMKDDQILEQKEYVEQQKTFATDRSLLTVENIVEFADCVQVDEVRDILMRQIECNTAIAKEGMTGKWGAGIGRLLINSYGDSVHNRAKAMAAAGSDARMNGCELPVVINSGSGNQGMTASLPVIVYAKELHVSEEMMLRALVVSNLVTIHLKTGIGRLSAYCGAISAGCGAGAGISYLYGGKAYEISHVIVNAVAINSGVICDGAKASCAAKIASAVEAGLLGVQMQKNGAQFYDGDGIVCKGVENTIRNIGELASKGMKETDKTIIRMMTR
ncbi:MAG: L-serine ammonia-lyase, iron-sulfur-dependent, subunit alpha [Lachnoclostridium sp.]|nr:L-serine ammonia-lyase, iron-sulfur-dependent, subunit alpha [Lachnoclostridium sp.]